MIPQKPGTALVPTTSLETDAVVFSWDSFILVFLSLFHIPIIPLGTEAVGLYDLYLAGYVLLRLTALKPSLQIDRRWILFFLCFALSILYHAIWLIFSSANKAIPLLIKQFELLLVFVVAADMVMRRGLESFVRSLTAAFALLAVYSAAAFAHGLGLLPLPSFLVQGNWYRVGLPFMTSISANPAGFVYGGFLILFIALPASHRTLRGWAVWIVCWVMFILTLSRTNLVALLFVLVVLAVMQSRRPFRIVLLLAVTVAVFASSFALLEQIVPSENRIWKILTLVRDPLSLVASDRSFQLRFRVLWPHAIEAWRQTPATVLFGTGTDAITIVDGTLPRLLGNEGLIGLALFVVAWFVSLPLAFPRNRGLLALLLFIAVNGINAETMLVSYRSTQVMALFLVAVSFLPAAPPAGRATEGERS